ncbi:MAG TPA: helix-turn-helix transcriptional regulator [Thermoanaerobaculia bacterium]|nr:helix-turn-helix transcriptional regulator [Thermoanaerobaculia bacterium]
MDPETQHVIDVLKQLMRAARLSNRDVERQLGVGGSYLSRLFAGTLELRFEHIVELGRVLGLAPHEFFQFVYPYPQDPPSETLVRLRQMLARLQPVPAAPAYAAESAAALERDLTRAVASVLDRITLRPAAETAAPDTPPGEPGIPSPS